MLILMYELSTCTMTHDNLILSDEHQKLHHENKVKMKKPI